MNRLLRPSIYERARVTIEEVQRLRQPTVLDIGSGSGVNALAFLDNGAASVVGLDFAPEMLSLARQRAAEGPYRDRASFEEADFNTWNPRGETFDVVAALGVFDYVAEAESFWKKMLDVSRRVAIASFPRYGARGMIRKVRYTMMSCPLFLFEEDQPRRWTAGRSDFRLEIPYRDASVFVAVARRTS